MHVKLNYVDSYILTKSIKSHASCLKEKNECKFMTCTYIFFLKIEGGLRKYEKGSDKLLGKRQGF